MITQAVVFTCYLCFPFPAGSTEHAEGLREQEEVAAILQKSQLARKNAEHLGKQLLQRLERSGLPLPGCCASPWEDLSSNSHTTRLEKKNKKGEGVLTYNWG